MAPGSFASIFGALIALALEHHPAAYLVVLAVLTVLGFPAAAYIEKNEGKKDPGCVVVDEVVGMMIAFWNLPLTWSVLWVGFFGFRAFDMFKIFPGNRLEKIPGGAGIMLDDIMAGIYTNIIMYVALKMGHMI